MAKSFIDVVQDSPMTGLGIPVKTKSAQDAGPRVQAPMRFLLAPVAAALCTPTELPRLHHPGDE